MEQESRMCCISICRGVSWNFTWCVQQQLLSITWEIVIRTFLLQDVQPALTAAILFQNPHICLGFLVPVWLFWNRVGTGGVPKSSERTSVFRGRGSPVWPWGHGADSLQGVEEVDLDSSTSRCLHIPLTQAVATVGLQSTQENQGTERPRGGRRHWGGSSLRCLPPGSWTFLRRPRWPGCSWHPSPHSPWAFNWATEERGGVWGLCRGHSWSRVGTGFRQGRRVQQNEVWHRKESHNVNHWWLIFIDEWEPEVVSLSLVDSSAIVQCLGW